MLTQTRYIEYLLSTPKNYTRTNLADHLPGISHDQANRFLRTSELPVSQLQYLVQPLLHDSPEAFLLVDDSMQDKRYNRFIKLTKRQYSGNVHGMVRAVLAWSTWSTAAGKPAIFCSSTTAYTLRTKTKEQKMPTFEMYLTTW